MKFLHFHKQAARFEMFWLFKLICCSIITLLIDKIAEVNTDFMFFNIFLNAIHYSATSRQKSAHKLTRRKQVGGNSVEHSTGV